jgi:hypothetical protein
MWLSRNNDIGICLLDMQRRWTKTLFETWKDKKWHKLRTFVSPFLFNNTYRLPVLTTDTKCRNQVFMLDWSIYRLFVLNRGWKRDPFQIIIFVICLVDMRHSWSKNAFSDVNNKKWRKWGKFVSLFLFNNTYGLPVFTTDPKCTNQKFCVWLVDL